MSRTSTGALKASGKSGRSDTWKWNPSTGANGKRIAWRLRDASLRIDDQSQDAANEANSVAREETRVMPVSLFAAPCACSHYLFVFYPA